MLCGADPRRQGGGQGSTALRGAGPRSAPRLSRAVWRGSGGAVLRRGQAARALAPKPAQYFYELFFWPDTCPLFATVYAGFWKNFVRLSCVKVLSDPEVDSPLHLKIWIFNEPLVSDSHFPWSCQSRLLDEFHVFSVKVESDPEVDSDCTRDKVCKRWQRWSSSPLLAAFFGLFLTELSPSIQGSF